MKDVSLFIRSKNQKISTGSIRPEMSQYILSFKFEHTPGRNLLYQVQNPLNSEQRLKMGVGVINQGNEGEE